MIAREEQKKTMQALSVPTKHHEARISRFLEGIDNNIHLRGGVSGLKNYADGKVPPHRKQLYSEDEASNLIRKGIENRMKVKISDHYNDLVLGRNGAPKSVPLSNLVTAREEEVRDLSGEIDPGNQLSFSPVLGLLHKYEMALLYTVKTCSAHCRYCYRLDLFTGKSGKPLARVDEVVRYILKHNSQVALNGGTHPETGRPLLQEVLLSGGDPMVLSDRKLGRWLAELAEAGIQRIRIGTKELAFYPYRFDGNFFAMLDRFHQFYPHVRVVFPVHFTHPDEFLKRNSDGEYRPTPNGLNYEWMPSVDRAVKSLAQRREYISIENQTPIIRDVNDDPECLAILQRELYHHGVGNHYFFQCRMIEGHKAFAIPVEETWRLFAESQKGLSGVERHARLVMSAEQGKIEVCSVGDPNRAQTKDPNLEQGFVAFKMHRTPGDAEGTGGMILARRNPNAFWITDYRDRLLYDESGVFKPTASMD